MPTVTPTAPSLQTPDGRAYPAGLLTAWAKEAKGLFSVTIKIRQAFDTGWRKALNEAAKLSQVCELHLNLVPKWAGGPDWKWVRAVLVDVAPLADSMRVYARLGNYPHDMGATTVSFDQQVLLEIEMAECLIEVAQGRILWAVGDDRGIVAAVSGWKARRKVFGSRQPACVEIQAYGASGTTAGNVALMVEAMREAGFSGLIAFAEHHRWFAASDTGPTDHPELVTAETGEYLLEFFEACRKDGVGYHFFTGEYAFNKGLAGLNPAGVALFDRPRREVKAWKPPVTKAFMQSLQLRMA